MNGLGFLSNVFEKKKKHSLGVCIPDSRMDKINERIEEKHSAEGKVFEVTGIFHVQESLMVKGKALGGTIKKKDKVAIGGTKFVVDDIQVGNQSADFIKEGQKGALYLKAKSGKFAIIRAGDFLEF